MKESKFKLRFNSVDSLNTYLRLKFGKKSTF